MKANLNSDRFANSVFNAPKKAVVGTSESVTPKKTWDLHNNITDSPSVFKYDEEFIAMDFGAVGGDDPNRHTEPIFYALIVDERYHYFIDIFHVAADEFLDMSRISYGALFNKP